MTPTTKPAPNPTTSSAPSSTTNPTTMRRAANEDLDAVDPTGRAEHRVRAAAANAANANANAVKPTSRFAWSPPTRRHFLGLVLAAGAISLGREALRPEPHPRSTWTGKTRWIGHC
jgi:hypothetical protein